MLIAAMILGLIGGILYFIGGCGITVADVGAPWWVYSMIPIGAVGTIGAALVFWNSNFRVFQLFTLSAVLLLVASVSAIVIGIATYDEFMEIMQFGYFGPPMHLFGGGLPYAPMPLLTLIIATALTIASQKRGVQESLTTP